MASVKEMAKINANRGKELWRVARKAAADNQPYTIKTNIKSQKEETIDEAAKETEQKLKKKDNNNPEEPDYKDKQKPDSKDMQKPGFSSPGTGAGPASLTKTIADFKQNIPYFEPLPILAGSVLLGALLIFS